MLTLYSREWSSEEGEGGREGRGEREKGGGEEPRERERENIIIFKSDLHFYNYYNLFV